MTLTRAVPLSPVRSFFVSCTINRPGSLARRCLRRPQHAQSAPGTRAEVARRRDGQARRQTCGDRIPASNGEGSNASKAPKGGPTRASFSLPNKWMDFAAWPKARRAFHRKDRRRFSSRSICIPSPAALRRALADSGERQSGCNRPQTDAASPERRGLPCQTPVKPPPPPRKKAKTKSSQTRIGPPPRPPAPKPPDNWVALSVPKTHRAATCSAAHGRRFQVPMDDWNLVRTPDGKVGWVLTRPLRHGDSR